MQVSRVNLMLVYGYTVPNLERMFLKFLEKKGEYSEFAGMVDTHQTAMPDVKNVRQIPLFWLGFAANKNTFEFFYKLVDLTNQWNKQTPAGWYNILA